METKKIRFATILFGLVMALSLIPDFALAADEGFDAQDDGKGTDLAPATTTALSTTQATNGESSQQLQAADVKPSQAIQATHMSAFTTDTSRNLNATLVEGDGSLSYAVKGDSGNYIEVDSSTGALTFKAAPPDNKAYVTVTAAATDTYAETSVDVPVKIYETYDYNIYLQTVQYSANKLYYLNSLDIKLVDKDGNEVGSTTVQNPRAGDSVTVSATNFVDRTYMTAHIQTSKKSAPFTLTGYSGVGGAINVYNGSRHSGRIFTCNYGMNAMDPEYTAPVAKTNLVANGSNQILIRPGSVSVGGNMEYNLGTKDGPDWNWGFGGLGYVRAADPGTYYVWWRTHNTDRSSAQYIGQGRSEIGPQCIEVTIAKGTINPTVSIAGWTYGETPKMPTVTGNAGNGAVTYEYKAKNAADSTYSTTVPTNAGEYTVRATIAATKIYNGSSATKDFTIAKAPSPVKVADSATVKVGGSRIKLDDYVRMNGATGAVTFSKTDEGDGCAITTESDGTHYFVSGQDVPSGTVSVTVTVAADGNYEALAETSISVTVTSKIVLIIYADDVTTTYVEGGYVSIPNVRVVTSEGTVPTADYGGISFPTDPPAGNEYLESASDLSNNLKILKAGVAYVTVSVGDDDHYAVVYKDVKVTINKATITPSVTLSGWTYGDPANTPTVTGNAGSGDVTYEYKAKGADDSTYTTDVPTLAGDYTVRATVPETTNYKGATCTKDFTIAPKKIIATVTALDKTYDGTTAATVSATVNAADLVQSDLDDKALVEDGKVTVSGLIASFADANAGENKTIILNYDNVVSPVANAECYEVTIAAMPTASIKKRAISAAAEDKSSHKGEAMAELTYGVYGPNGLAEGDTLESLGITASTTATSSSEVGEYPITLSGGAANPNYEVTLGEDATYTIEPEKPVYRPTEGNGSSWDANDKDGLTITFKRSVNDNETFSHFTGIRVDGVDVAKTDYDAVPGSVVVTLHNSFLATLAPGDHTITALFDDGDPAQAAFAVEDASAAKDAPAAEDATTAKAAPASTAKASGSDSSIAKTGDALPVPALAVLVLVAIAAVAAALYARRRVR
jgi:hypothetical protein